MSVLSALKLVAAKPQRVMDPVQLRRAKLVTKLDEQIELARAQAEGGNYTPTRTKHVKDAAGNVSVVQVPKRVRAWWWSLNGEKVCVALRYGNKVMELAKGKSAVECTKAELVGVIEMLRNAVKSGELDNEMASVSGTQRKNFKK